MINKMESILNLKPDLKEDICAIANMAENNIVKAQKYLFWFFFSGKLIDRDIDVAMYWILKFKKVPVNRISEETKLLMLKNSCAALNNEFSSRSLKEIRKYLENTPENSTSDEDKAVITFDRSKITKDFCEAVRTSNRNRIAQLIPILIENWESPINFLKKDQDIELDVRITEILKTNSSQSRQYVQEEINRLGIKYKRQDDYDKAIYCYYKAMALNPNDQDAYYNLGKAYYLKQEWLYALESYLNCFKKINFVYDSDLMAHMGHALLDSFIMDDSYFKYHVRDYRFSISGRGASVRGSSYDNLCVFASKYILDYFKKNGTRYMTDSVLRRICLNSNTTTHRARTASISNSMETVSDAFNQILRKLEKIEINGVKFDCQPLSSHRTAVEYGDSEGDNAIYLRIPALMSLMLQPKKNMMNGDFSSAKTALDNLKVNIDEFIQDYPRTFISYCTFASTYYNLTACYEINSGNEGLAKKLFAKSIILDFIYDCTAFDINTVNLEEKWFIKECTALSNLSLLTGKPSDMIYKMIDYAEIAKILINFLISVSKLNCMSEFGVACYLKIICNLFEISVSRGKCKIDIRNDFTKLYNLGNSYSEKTFKNTFSDKQWGEIFPLLDALVQGTGSAINVDSVAEKISNSL